MKILLIINGKLSKYIIKKKDKKIAIPPEQTIGSLCSFLFVDGKSLISKNLPI